jgi:predicted PurR-regulated permease PerM
MNRSRAGLSDDTDRSPVVFMDTRVRTKSRGQAVAPPWLTRERVLVIALGLVTLGVAYAGAKVVEPFVPALTWALALAVVAYPLDRRLREWVKQPSLAAGAASAIVTLVIALPLFFAGGLMMQQAVETMQEVRAAIDDGRWKEIVPSGSSWRPVVDWLQAQLAPAGLRDEMLGSLANGVKRAASGAIHVATEALFTVFFLFYFLRDHSRFLNGVARLVPLSREETGEVLGNVHDMIRAMVGGTLAVALLQGFLGGLAFWWLGLPAPVLWGGVMALLSVLPMFGAALVWLPTALYLAMTGNVGPALMLTAWGALVIGLVDNLLKPVLVKTFVHVHTVAVFIAVLGGLFAFGGTGILLGPIILAVATGLIDVWRRRFDDGVSVEAGVDSP